MSLVYQYDAEGYFAGSVEDLGLLPNNATSLEPEVKDGFIPKWNGEGWEQVEDHKGKEGYLEGKPHTIKDYGPLPEGWSDTPPEPTEAEKAQRRMAEIDAAIAVLEQKTIRPSLAKELGLDEDFDHQRLKDIMTQIIDLRCERQMLEAIAD